MKRPSLEITKDLFQIYLASTPSYIGSVDPRYVAELMMLHKPSLEKFIKHNLANRKLEVLFIAAANSFLLNPKQQKNTVVISETAARQLSLLVKEFKRRGATSINTPMYTSIADSLIAGLYTTVMTDIENPVPTEVDLVEVDRDDYTALYNFINNSSIVIGDVNNNSAMYRLLYSFSRLSMYALLRGVSNDHRDRIYDRGRQTMNLRTGLQQIKNSGLGNDTTNFAAYPAVDAEFWHPFILANSSLRNGVKQFRKYSHLDKNSLLALRGHLVVPEVEVNSTVKVDNKASLFLALQKSLYCNKDMNGQVRSPGLH
jgi:hypothetical protein